MSASLLVPKDGGQGASREPLSVMVLHQDHAALQRAQTFYHMMEEEFGDDFCFDCVYWPATALDLSPQAVTQDASEADLVLVAMGQARSNPLLEGITAWLRSVRAARHSPFSLVCLTDDPSLASGSVHSDLQHLAGHFSMVYLAPNSQENNRAGERQTSLAPISLSPVPFDQLVDPHHTGGIND